ncbi:hypothetical protein KM043_000021, partial [Ampulex compressa]
PAHWIFEPPCPWEELPKHSKRENSWLITNFHGIDWDAGNIPYDRHPHIIKDLGRLAAGTDQVMIYVKGKHKVEWLTRFVDHVFDLEDIMCPSLHEPGFREPVVCDYHRPGWTENCALQNVLALKQWLRNHFDQLVSQTYNLTDDDSDFNTSESDSLTLTSNSDDDMYQDTIHILNSLSLEDQEEEEGDDMIY